MSNAEGVRLELAELSKSGLASSSTHEASDFVRRLAHFVGPGFHPDTPFEDYVVVDTGRRSFNPQEVALLNTALHHAWTVLDRGGVDICSVALPIQRAMLEAQR